MGISTSGYTTYCVGHRQGDIKHNQAGQKAIYANKSTRRNQFVCSIIFVSTSTPAQGRIVYVGITTSADIKTWKETISRRRK